MSSLAGADAGSAAGSSIGGSAEIAFSRFAAYPQLGQTATRSSPDDDGHMNSIESLPPMLPLDASTAMAGMPSRAKIRSYAARCRSNEASSPASSTSKL